MVYRNLIKPALFRLEAEKAHSLAYRFAKTASGSKILKGLARLLYGYRSPKLSQNIWGLSFPGPVGLAAGFDKNGHIPEIMEAAGFGFVEVGSITGRPSAGNPPPRLFRLPDDKALVNRMGLNNDGAQTVARRMEKKRVSVPTGINIAKTHDPSLTGDAAIEDYLHSFRQAREVADYITLNISCPNTSDGKTFEEPGALVELLSALNIRDDARSIPTLVKFSPDLERKELLPLLEVCEDHRINGYVATNTSSSRERLKTRQLALKRMGEGGLSGTPLLSRSVRMVRWIREATNARKPIIGVGGIDSFESALEMIRSGADLLQVYTGLVYEGPGLAARINRSLVRHLETEGKKSIHQIRRHS